MQPFAVVPFEADERAPHAEHAEQHHQGVVARFLRKEDVIRGDREQHGGKDRGALREEISPDQIKRGDADRAGDGRHEPGRELARAEEPDGEPDQRVSDRIGDDLAEVLRIAERGDLVGPEAPVSEPPEPQGRREQRQERQDQRGPLRARPRGGRWEFAVADQSVPPMARTTFSIVCRAIARASSAARSISLRVAEESAWSSRL